MTTTATVETRCPACGEDRLIVRDPTLQCWVCEVCSKQWRMTRQVMTLADVKPPLGALTRLRRISRS